MVFFEHAVNVKKWSVIINDNFLSQCTIRLVEKPQNTAVNGPSCSRSLNVKYLALRSMSQVESMQQVGELLPELL